MPKIGITKIIFFCRFTPQMGVWRLITKGREKWQLKKNTGVSSIFEGKNDPMLI
jgi:hypothetical protein